jgi:hypothetical protein
VIGRGVRQEPGQGYDRPLRRPHRAALVLVLLACSGPFGLLPGGGLEGKVQSVPSDWTFAGDYGTAQLETRPEDPYSVNLAYTIVDGTLYINAGDTETQWVQNMTVNPEVRLRVDGVLYELNADRVIDADEIARFAEAWTSQSMFRRDPTGLDEVWIYRLRAR